MGNPQYNQLSGSPSAQTSPEHSPDLEQSSGTTLSDHEGTKGGISSPRLVQTDFSIEETDENTRQGRFGHGMGLSRLISSMKRSSAGRLHLRRPRGPGSIKRATILGLLITVMLVVFRYYHTTTVAMNQWQYHETPRNDLAKSIINLLSSSEDKLSELRLDQTILRRPERKRMSKWRLKYTMTTFDPRLPVALYVAQVADYLESHDENFDPKLELEFCWKDWTDFNKRLLPSDRYLSAHRGQPISGCAQFIEETGFSTRRACRDLSADEVAALPDPAYPRFKITGVSDPRIARDARVLMAGTYLYHEMPAPERIIFVDAASARALAVRTVESKGRQPLLDHLMAQYRQAHADTNEISIVDQMRRLNGAIDKTRMVADSAKYADLDVMRVVAERVDKQRSAVQLDSSAFEWRDGEDSVKEAAQSAVAEIERKCQDAAQGALECDPKYSTQLRLNKEVVEFADGHPKNDFPKFFHEAGYTPIGADNGAHLDWRFISSRKLPEYESKSGLHRLMRAWLRFTRTAGIDTWIAHGSLLGYYFNGLTLAWDFDHDVQVTQAALVELARKYAHSVIVDVSGSASADAAADAPAPQDALLADIGMGAYYLDVGNSFFYRAKGNGRNAIDARFIDVHTGLFIDITALAFAKERPSRRAMGKNLANEHKKFLLDNDVAEKDFRRFLMDRNNHYYLESEISPVIPALFEGERAFLPQRVLRILGREYMRYRNNWSWEEHTWRSRYRTWVPDSVCARADREGNSCSNNPEVRLDELFQREYIDRHMVMKKQLEDSGETKIVKAPIEAQPYPKVLRPDATLMKIALERDA